MVCQLAIQPDQVASPGDVSQKPSTYYFTSKKELYINVLRQLMSVLRPLQVSRRAGSGRSHRDYLQSNWSCPT